MEEEEKWVPLEGHWGDHGHHVETIVKILQAFSKNRLKLIEQRKILEYMELYKYGLYEIILCRIYIKLKQPWSGLINRDTKEVEITAEMIQNRVKFRSIQQLQKFKNKLLKSRPKMILSGAENDKKWKN